MLNIILGIIVAFISGVVISPVLIPFLRKLKFGQEILEIGPNWHKSKSGTPTMGGIAFIAAISLCMIIFKADLSAYIVFAFALICGIVGFTDDFIKVYLKRNMGFNVKQKTMCLVIAIVLFVLGLKFLNITDTNVYIPFFRVYIDFGIWYYPIVIIGIFYMVNSVNLTDGIDGLAGSVTAIVLVFYTVTCFMLGNTGLSVLSAASLGAVISFLVFNLHPAKMFMGDTGSLFLGGLVTGIAVAMKSPLIIVIAGLIYVIESLSVVIQVASFKLTGKRVFKMSPIHHHFEMCGFSENKIVIMFSLVTLLMCVAGFFGIVNI